MIACKHVLHAHGRTENCADVLVPQARTKVGALVKVRVLEVDADKRRCLLTMKRSLLESTLPIVTSYAQAAAGAPTLVTHGFVTALRPSLGMIVTFYDNVHGLVSEKEMAAAVIQCATLWMCVCVCGSRPLVMLSGHGRDG